MTDEIKRCALCGEPMPPGEEMSNYHGFSGDCPKPPLKKPVRMALIEYLHDERDGSFWLDITVDGAPYQSLAFETPEERQRAQDDLLGMMRSQGARDASAPGRA